MKKIQILFTREKALPFKKAGSFVNDVLEKQVSAKFIDLKKSFTVDTFDGKTLVFVSRVDEKTTDFDKLQSLGATLAHKAKSQVKEKEKGNVEIIFDGSLSKDDSFFLEKGVLLAQASSKRFQTKEKEGEITFSGLKNAELKIIVDAMDITRDLTAKPSNILTPQAFEDTVLELAKHDKNLQVKILRKKDLEKENMNMHLAVNAGSPNEARLIVIEYNPEKSKDAPVALIGKGLIYDSGGLYAKPYPHMNDMFGDMAGAATVVGVLSALSKLGVKKRVVGACPLAENLIDGHSYRNGDILTSRKGITVHVEHSDAEGRLVLGDALSYIEDTYKPKMMFDYATLTGAVVAAIGQTYTGIFSDNEKLIEEFITIGKSCNDKVWPLPFDDDIKDCVKSKVADITNTGDKRGILGASTAAAFLSNFVSDTKKWIHFDIAGTAHRDEMRKSYDLKSLVGTGAMVHSTLAYLMKHK